jgi:DNA-binding response OmpR family regulator
MESVAGRTVLLVEDDVATRALIARQLRRAGLDVVAVESGERVLAEAADRYAAFDVVILTGGGLAGRGIADRDRRAARRRVVA